MESAVGGVAGSDGGGGTRGAGVGASEGATEGAGTTGAGTSSVDMAGSSPATEPGSEN